MADFLLEIGCEEIPAGFLPEGRAAIVASFEKRFAGLAKTVRATGTPRRLILEAKGLPAETASRRETVKGPPLRVAFDESGRPTKAAEGFAKKTGVPFARLLRRDGYLFAEVVEPGRPLGEVLAEELPKILDEMAWPKSMRWDESGKRFVRPVRWIVATLSDSSRRGKTVRFSWGGVESEAKSRRWVLSGGRVKRKPVAFSELRKAGIEWDHARRAARLEKALAAAARKAKAEPVWPKGAAATAAFLADHLEAPDVVTASFDEAFLEVPEEILVLTMWRHQKFVPLREKSGRLAPRFLVACDATFRSPKKKAVFRKNVRSGAERVVAARLADARYFWDEDRKKGLTALREATKEIRFVEGLGSVHDRAERLARAAGELAAKVGLAKERSKVERAARLAKFDLASSLVFEFPELEGTIGRRLAESFGELPQVAAAIADHYLPKGPDDPVPKGLAVPVALADKADLILGVFSVGKKPTASADPYGLRRAAIGIVRILLENDLDLSLGAIWDAACAAYAEGGREISRETLDDVARFVRARLAGVLAERTGARGDFVEAILSADAERPRDALDRLEALLALAGSDDFEALVTSSKRVLNILEGEEGKGEVDAEAFVEDAERALEEAVETLERRLAEAPNARAAFAELASVRPAVDRFFDEVLVNTEDARLRENRKRLLRRLGGIFLRHVDFQRITS